MKKTITFLTLITFCFLTNLFSQTNTFIGEGDGENWNDATNWDLGIIPTSAHDVVIDATVGGGYLQVVFNVGLAGGICKSLTITEGAQLFRSPLFASTRFLKVYDNIVNNGTIGNGTTFDGIGFEFVGTNQSVSGSGVFDAAIIRRGVVTSDNTTTLTINQNINLRATSGTVFFNNSAGLFNVTLSSGYTINCIAGNVSIDGASGSAGTENGGSFSIAGILNVSGTIYLTTNNSTNPCEFTITNGGVINCNGINAPASGSAGNTLNINSGGKLKFLTGGFGIFSNTNNTFTFDGTVEYASFTDQTVENPANYNNLIISGAGIKSLGNNITVNGNFTRSGTATFANSGHILTYGGSSTLVYSGNTAQTTGEEFPSVLNSSLIIDNLNDVTLNSSRSISGTVTLLNGNLKTGANILSLSSISTVIESADRYIIGEITISRNVGTLSNNFGSIGLEINAGDENLGTVTVNRLSGPAGINSFGANKSIARRWTLNIDGTQPTSERTLTFSWVPNDDNGSQLNATRVWKYDGTSTWQDLSGVPIDASSRTIAAVVTSITNSAFTVSDETAPLPVELTSFSAAAIGLMVNLNWDTATETNNFGFEVERSSIKNEWEKIGFVNGSGNSNSPKNYSFVDSKVSTGKYSYRLKQLDNDGQFEYSNTVEVDLNGANKFELSQNYPNPFNPTTTIKFSLPEAGNVKLTLFNILGQEVKTLVNESKESGVHTINFDATELNSGIYIYKLESYSFTQTRKMTLVR
jgi:hypothetical protein